MKLLTFVFLFLFPTSAAAQIQTPAEIYASLGPAVARIDYDAELYDGTREAGTGSAFLISADGLLLTCKHVVPNADNYRTFSMKVRLGRMNASPLTPSVVWIANDEDLAVLQIPITGAPTVHLGAANAPPGSDVVVLGFPLNLDLNITRGIVSGSGTQGRYVMDAVINAGNSGGPVIDLNGVARGVAWGAALRWRVGDEEIPVEGVKYFIPTSAVLALLPPDLRARVTTPVRSASIAIADTIRRAETVQFMKDDHPVLFASHRRTYRTTLAAEPGYKIVGWKLSETSRNHVPAVDVAIAQDGRTAEVRAVLESGPAVDRWRGWLMATVELEQKKIE